VWTSANIGTTSTPNLFFVDFTISNAGGDPTPISGITVTLQSPDTTSDSATFAVTSPWGMGINASDYNAWDVQMFGVPLTRGQSRRAGFFLQSKSSSTLTPSQIDFRYTLSCTNLTAHPTGNSPVTPTVPRVVVKLVKVILTLLLDLAKWDAKDFKLKIAAILNMAVTEIDIPAAPQKQTRGTLNWYQVTLALGGDQALQSATQLAAVVNTQDQVATENGFSALSATILDPEVTTDTTGTTNPPSTDSGSSGLSGGAIAGIVIGCVFGALLIVVVLVLVLRKGSDSGSSAHKNVLM